MREERWCKGEFERVHVLTSYYRSVRERVRESALTFKFKVCFETNVR